MEDDTKLKKQKGQKIIIVSIVLIVLVGAFLLNIFFSQNKKQPEQKQTTPESIHLVPEPKTKETKVPGQIIVKFKKGVTEAQITQKLSSYSATVKKKINGINSYVIEVPKGQEDTVLEKLKSDTLLDYSEPDYIQKVNFVPNDPNFIDQWGLHNTGQMVGGKSGVAGADIAAEAAWDVTQGGVTVAVIDTGIDADHPDLTGQIVGQKIFVTNTIQDKYGHGTHVAGVIAAHTNNGIGVAGVCPNCKLLIAKAMDDQGLGQTSVLAEAIIWAADNGAKVINMSEGGEERSQAQAEAIAYAWGKGAVVVAAAGNNNSVTPFYPAALKEYNVISVASSDNKDVKPYFSNFGSWVMLAAPGENIFSTMPTYAYGMQSTDPLSLRYDYLSGTSMSAPIVSGVAGLVWASQYGTSNASVRDRLLNNVDKIAGTGTYWTYGRVDAAKAVGEAAQSSPSASAAPSVSTNPIASISPATPTNFCLGAVDCGAEQPSTTLAPGESPGVEEPSTEPGTEEPSTAPGTEVSPSTEPCENTEISTQHNRHKHHHKDGWFRHFFRDFLQFLIELINKLIEMLGGNGGITLPPTDPCITPTVSPGPTEGEEPTGEEPSTEPSVTGAPTSGASTNATMDRISAYGWPDNDPPGGAIAHPGLHSKAGGTGTFADPISFAVATGSQDIMPPGMKVYIPSFKKYFIMEDSCAGCVRMQMDLWAGGDGSNDDAVLACEGKIDRDNIAVELNAPDGREVDSQPFVDASGTCNAPAK